MIAVADGATEAIYAGSWARTLVGSAERDWPVLDDPSLDERLARARASFQPLDGTRPAPWWIENKFRMQGSQATLLVAQLLAPFGRNAALARACAVGDSFVAVLRTGGRLRSFPCTRASEFGTRPNLVQSRPVAARFARWQTVVREGDVVVAGTDAIGRWMLQCHEAGRTDRVVDLLIDCVREDRAFDALIAGLREAPDGLRLANDDTTLVVACLPAESEGAAGLVATLERSRAALPHTGDVAGSAP